MAATGAGAAAAAGTALARASLCTASAENAAASASAVRVGGSFAALKRVCSVVGAAKGGSSQVASRRSLAVSASSAAAAEAEVSALADKFNGDGITIDNGLGDLPRVILTSADGSIAEVYLYGACTTSWKIPSGEDLLFVRPDAVFTGQKPISGGIPHCFPQFGPGKIQQHGFARNLSWDIHSVKAGDAPSVVLRLADNDYSRAMWDFAFEALFEITLGTGELTTTFTVTNTDSKPFSFTTALHTYFRADISQVKVKGLKGLQFLNKDPDPTNPIPGVEEREEVTFPGFVDCMYLNAPSKVTLDNGLGTSLDIANQGWSDAVVWNPHLTMEACYKDFVCVENAQLKEVVLQPGESWKAVQQLKPQ